MTFEQRAGRPRASSRDTIAEAATELFLERGYDETAIADITSRAGVSRSSFFNYFASKSDLIWGTFDERMRAVTTALAAADIPVRAALVAVSEGFVPDVLALAIGNSATMGLTDELERERALRQSRLGAAVAARLLRDGADALTAQVIGAGYAAAVLAAIWTWAADGPGRTALAGLLASAIDVAENKRAADAGPVRQLRLVVRAADFDEALRFYRDDLGLAERESYQGDGGARVVILAAGEATLELSNPAQVELIDRVETDGGTSDRLRVALEVADTAAAVQRLTDAGARLEASARVTPWRSLNARLRAPADLQVTLFQELGDDGRDHPLP